MISILRDIVTTTRQAGKLTYIALHGQLGRDKCGRGWQDGREDRESKKGCNVVVQEPAAAPLSN